MPEQTKLERLAERAKNLAQLGRLARAADFRSHVNGLSTDTLDVYSVSDPSIATRALELMSIALAQGQTEVADEMRSRFLPGADLGYFAVSAGDEVTVYSLSGTGLGLMVVDNYIAETNGASNQATRKSQSCAGCVDPRSSLYLSPAAGIANYVQGA